MQNRSMSVLYGIAGAVALACTTFMVHSLGMFQGATTSGQWTLGIASVVVHLGGVVVFGIGTGMAFKAGQRARAWVGVLIVLGAGIFSLWNISGYVIAHNQGVIEAQAKHDAKVAARDKAALDSDRERQRTQVELAKEELRWSRGTSREADGRRERKDLAETRAKLIAEMGKGDNAAKASHEPVAPSAVVVRPDASAAMAERLTGVGRDNIMLLVSLFMALLLVVIEATAWMRCGYHWNNAATDGSLPSSKKGGSGDSGSGMKSTEESKDKPATDAANVVPIRAEQAQLQAASNPPPTVRRVQSDAPKPPLPLTLKPKSKTLAELLAMQPSWPSQKALADAMGVSPAKVSRDLQKLKGRGKVEAKRKWRSNAITARNGNGSTFHAFG